jgi:hypothetical protein
VALDLRSRFGEEGCHREEWHLWLRRVPQRCPAAGRGVLPKLDIRKANMEQVTQVAQAAVIKPAQLCQSNLDYINLVKGFSRVFWGLALTTVLLLSQAKFEFILALKIPAYLLGTVVHFWGLVTLYRAGEVSARWNTRLSLAIVLVLMEVFFFPFMRWWKMMPAISYFTWNIGVLSLSAVCSLLLCNLIAADFFRRLALKGECLEASIYALAVIIFMAFPFFAAVIFSFIASRRYQTFFSDEIIEAVYQVPVWLYFIVVIPVSMTLAILWKARDRSYQRFCKERIATKMHT